MFVRGSQGCVSNVTTLSEATDSNWGSHPRRGAPLETERRAALCTPSGVGHTALLARRRGATCLQDVRSALGMDQSLRPWWKEDGKRRRSPSAGPPWRHQPNRRAARAGEGHWAQSRERVQGERNAAGDAHVAPSRTRPPGEYRQRLSAHSIVDLCIRQTCKALHWCAQY